VDAAGVTTPEPPAAGAPGAAGRASLLVAAGILAAGFGLVAALLADLQETFGFPTWGLGLIAGVSFLTGFAGHVTLGPLADRGALRLMLAGGALAGVLSLVWLAAATRLWEFVAARALVGIAEGAFLPAARRLVVAWRPDRPGTELGRLLGAGMAGFVAGPVAGGVLASGLGLRGAFLVPAAALAAAVPFLGRMPVPALPAVPGGSIWSLLRRPIVRAALLLGSAEFFVFGALEAIWARLLTDRGASTTEVGLSLTLVVLPLPLLTPLAGRFADRIDPARLAAAAVAGLTVVSPLYGIVTGAAATVAVGVLQAAVTSGSAPASQALLTGGVPPGRVAAGQGLLEGFGLLVAAAAALPVGWVYGTLGTRWIGVGLAVPTAALLALGVLEVRRARAAERAEAGG
jgi:DHA1 family multidrug resistance protein-like MFS transporter